MEGLPVNGLDLAVLAVLLITVLIATALGFVRTVLLFAAWAAAIYAGSRVWSVVTTWEEPPELFLRVSDSLLLAQVATTLAVFVGVLIVCWILAHFASKAVRRTARPARSTRPKCVSRISICASARRPSTTRTRSATPAGSTTSRARRWTCRSPTTCPERSGPPSGAPPTTRTARACVGSSRCGRTTS